MFMAWYRLKYYIIFLLFGLVLIFAGIPPDSFADVVVVSNVRELMKTVRLNSKGNLTVLLENGIYHIPRSIYINGDNITYKGIANDRSAVVIKGNGPNGRVNYIFSIKGKHATVQNLTIGEVRRHGIQVHGEADADSVVIWNVGFYDIREQMIKGSYNRKTPDLHADRGRIENCLFEFTRGKAFQSYTGGIDIHHGENWIVKNNIFKNIRNPGGRLTEGAIHFWNNSNNILVEDNKIINCDRGIMFGLDNSQFTNGMIKNNFIQTTGDTGIYLCNASNVQVLNNTVFIDSGYPNAIEYRFKNTVNNFIANNLTNRAIVSRDQGSARVINNVTSAKKQWFVDVKKGDLHLDQKINLIAGKGIFFPEIKQDIDGDIRKQSSIDIGADENKALKYKIIDHLKLSTDKNSIWSDGFDTAVLKIKAFYKDRTNRFIEPDKIICINEKITKINPFYPVIALNRPGIYIFKVESDGIYSNPVKIQVRDVGLKQANHLKAYHVAGRTFLTFNKISNYFHTLNITYGEYFKTKKGIKNPVKYKIYRSKKIITSLTGLKPVATIGSFSGWNEKFYGIYTGSKKYANRKAVRYTIKSGAPPLEPGKGLFVFSPAENGDFYYAVTAEIKGHENKTIKVAENSLAVPVRETKGMGLPVLQRIESRKVFLYVKNVKLYFYTRWESPPNCNRNSIPFDYLVAIPPKLKIPAPVGIHMHGWGGNLLGGYAWWNNAEKGAILLATNQFPYDWWTGYNENFGMKNKAGFQKGVVRPYTTNRLFSFLDYLKKHSQWKIDLKRTFTAGSSMGGSGSLMMAIRYPDKIAWARSWVGVHIPEKSPRFKGSYARVWGKPEANIKFEDGTPVWDYYNDAKYLYKHPEKEVGFLTFCNGKNDSGIGWAQAVEFLRALQATKRPHLFIWGQAGHGQRTIMPGNNSQRVMPIDIRTNQSLPAFTNCSLDENPGNGDPKDGDPKGQINRWLFWDTKDLVDLPDRWEITVGLMAKAPAVQCFVDITPRRLQKMVLMPGEKIRWENRSLKGAIIGQGSTFTDKNGLITLHHIKVLKIKNRITIKKE